MAGVLEVEALFLQGAKDSIRLGGNGSGFRVDRRKGDSYLFGRVGLGERVLDNPAAKIVVLFDG